MVGEHDLRKAMLTGTKTERIIFATTPTLKRVVQSLSSERCLTASAYITSLIVEDAANNREVLPSELFE